MSVSTAGLTLRDKFCHALPVFNKRLEGSQLVTASRLNTLAAGGPFRGGWFFFPRPRKPQHAGRRAVGGFLQQDGAILFQKRFECCLRGELCRRAHRCPAIVAVMNQRSSDRADFEPRVAYLPHLAHLQGHR